MSAQHHRPGHGRGQRVVDEVDDAVVGDLGDHEPAEPGEGVLEVEGGVEHLAGPVEQFEPCVRPLERPAGQVPFADVADDRRRAEHPAVRRLEPEVGHDQRALQRRAREQALDVGADDALAGGEHVREPVVGEGSDRPGDDLAHGAADHLGGVEPHDPLQRGVDAHVPAPGVEDTDADRRLPDDHLEQRGRVGGADLAVHHHPGILPGAVGAMACKHGNDVRRGV